MKGKHMRSTVLGGQLVVSLLLAASVAQAGVGMDVNIHVGDQPREVVVRQPPPPPVPVVVGPPVREIVIEQDVDFIFPQSLGFYVAVGVPYDLFFLGNRYYMFTDGRWLYAPSSHGPWAVTSYRELPPRLRKYRIDRIRECRTREYEIYRHDHDNYRGKHFRAGKEEWKAQRKEAKEERKWERKQAKEERKWERKQAKEERKWERHAEKERRKEEKHAEKWDKHGDREERGERHDRY
ncbi:hypothetical protein LPW11_16230 [Geomonas sp. RF6]|uniref:hypothetical protein n=1 Tax=Geomonas sp. RF6 TaxID=2897342 RepID=UPI001E3FAF21|nr:hypothetical protein [Geomonas sp. RF6]UFS69436.1 hypothetical protein LPW11_16230 [Geomonas sp. RF6]